MEGKTMTDSDRAGVRFPFINLEKAIGRVETLYKADPKGRDMAISAAFGVWEYSEKSSGGFQTVSALKMYGLLRDAAKGDAGRKIALTEDALRYFRDEREEVRQKLLEGFALHPRLIAALWREWKTSPPADTIARSHLKAERGLSDQGARSLLAIYKENIAFANLKGDAKIPEVEEEEEGETDNPPPPHREPPGRTPPPPLRGKLMDGERELATGLLSKTASFRLIVNGPVGLKEIERLIAKLEFDKEILADQGDSEGEQEDR
jgi:hypothetical protein